MADPTKPYRAVEDFDAEIAKYATPAPSPAKTILQPTTPANADAKSQAETIYYAQSHTKPLGAPDPLTAANTTLKGLAEYFVSGIEGGQKGVEDSLNYTKVLSGERTLKEAQQQSAKIGGTKTVDFTKDGGLLGTAESVAQGIGTMVPETQHELSKAFGAPIETIQDIMPSIYRAYAGTQNEGKTTDQIIAEGKVNRAKLFSLDDPSLHFVDALHEMAAAQSFKSLTDEGIPEDVAKPIAHALGYTSLALNLATLGAGGVGLKAGAAAAEQTIGRHILSHALKFGRGALINSAAIGAQEAAKLIGETIAKAQSGKHINGEELSAKVVDGLVRSIAAGTLMHGGATAVGFAGSKLFSMFKKIKPTSTVAEAQQVVHQAAHNPDASLTPAELKAEMAAEAPTEAPAPLTHAEKLHAAQDAFEATEYKKARIKDSILDAELHGQDPAPFEKELKKARTEHGRAIRAKRRAQLAVAKDTAKEAVKTKQELFKVAAEKQRLAEKAQEDLKSKEDAFEKKVGGKDATNSDKLYISLAKDKLKSAELAQSNAVQELQHAGDMVKETQKTVNRIEKIAARDAKTDEFVQHREDREPYLERMKIEKEANQKRMGQIQKAAIGDNPDRAIELDKQNFDLPQATVSRLEQHIRGFGKSIFSWDGLWAIVFQDVKDDAEREALIDSMRVGNIIRDAEHEKRQQLDKMWSTLSRHTGLTKDELVDRLIKDSSTEMRNPDGSPLTFRRADGSRGALVHGGTKGILGKEQKVYTVAEGRKLLAQMDDLSIRDALIEGNNFTVSGPQSTREVLQGAIDAEGEIHKQIHAGIRDYLDNENAPRLSEAHEAATGEKLKLVDNYSGPAQHEGIPSTKPGEDDPLLASLNPATGRTSGKAAAPGAVHERVNSKLPLAPSNDILDVIKLIAQTEHYRGWQEPSRFFASQLNDKDFRETVARKLGPKFLVIMRDHYKDMVHGVDARQSEWIDLSNLILKNSGPAFLGLKAGQYAKQWASIINIGQHMPSGQAVKYLHEYFADLRKNSKLADISKEFGNRYAEFDNTFLGAITKQDVKSLKKSKVKDVILWTLRKGDEHTVRAMFYAVYKYNKEVLNKTEEASIDAAERAFVETQSTGRMDQLSSLTRNPNTKILMAFSQQNTRILESQITDWRTWSNNRTKANLKKAINTTVIAHLSQAAFAAVGVGESYVGARLGEMVTGQTNTHKDSDLKDGAWTVAREGILGPQAGLYGPMIVTPTATIGQNALFGTHDRWFDPNTLPSQTADYGLKLLAEAIKDKPLAEKAMAMTMDAMRSVNLVAPGLGIPVQPVSDTNAFIKDYGKGIFNGIGNPSSDGNRRYNK